MRLEPPSTTVARSVRVRTPLHRRLSLFGLACALLLTSVMVLPANAAAVGSTIVSLDVAPSSVTAGGRVRVSGIVRSTARGVSGAGRTVSVFVRTTTAGAPWRHIGSTRTDSCSRYSMFWTANGMSQLQVRFAGSVDLAAAKSVARSLRVRAALSAPRIAGLRTAVLTGTRLTWTARTSPAAAGARVSVQVLSGRWREVVASKVAAGGTISVVLTPAVGVQRYRLAVQRTPSLAGVESAQTVVRTAPRTKVGVYTPFRPDGSVKIRTNTYDPAKYGRTSCSATLVSLAAGVWECGNREFSFATCWVRTPGARQLVCYSGPTPALFAGARPAIEPATSVGCPVRAQLERWLPRGQQWPSSARILCVDGGWTLVLDGAGKPRQMFRPVKLGWRSFSPGGICDDPSPFPPGLWVRNCQGP